MRFRFLGPAAFIAALSLSVPVTSGALLTGQWPSVLPSRDVVWHSLVPLIGGTPATAAVKTAAAGAAATPVTIGTQIAGSFGDATGHSAQSHLVYAANSKVWWLFTLTSAADAQGGSNHIVKAYHSSGPDLTTATWVAAADSPGAASGSPNGSLAGGRSLGVAYVNNSPVDVIHADISMAFDGQDGRTGHIRGVVTGTTITWSTWNFFDEPAATWTEPHGNVVGVSTGKFIHTGGPILQQEVDANARKSTTADTGSTWTSGFAQPSVIDGSMLNQNNAFAFAPLASDVMLALYDNGQNNEPNLTNLRFKKSNANGTWPSIVVGSQMGGDGNVFSTNATIDQNDWAIAPVSVNRVYAFRRKAGGSGIDAASYNVAANSWSAMSPAPPAFVTGQAAKAGAGVFAATDGVNTFLCVINTDSANSILSTRFDGTTWAPWTTVPGTDIGIQTRNYLSGSPQAGSGQVGLIWTEGASFFDIVATSYIGAPDVQAPVVSMTAPAAAATVTGVVSISAAASDNVGVAGVQFRLDGADLGLEVTSPPYSIFWNSATSVNGTHVLTAIARDSAGNTTTAASVSVTVANVQTPIITWTPPLRIVAGTALTTTQLNAAANTPGAFVYTPGAGTILPAGLGQPLSTRFTPTDATLFTTATASVAIDVVLVVPNVAGLTQTAASSAIVAAGLTVGTVTRVSSLTVPSGSVISQTPAAATESGSTLAVDLVVSSGSVAVPNVAGLTQSAATTAITAAGLTLGAVTTASSTTVPSGSVISQNPAAGTQITSGSSVALVVSSGPPQVAVPNVVGLPQAAATTSITTAGLTVGTITTSSSATVPSGSVISQNPAAATQVVSGSAVALVVSSGPAQVAVPNVVGLTQAAATTSITNAGLKVGTITNSASATVPAGSVISQNPVGGTQVASGSSVALVVSSGLAQASVPNVVGLTQGAASTAIISASLTVGAVTTASSSTVPSGTVISESPTAGTLVVTGSAVSLLVSSGPAPTAGALTVDKTISIDGVGTVTTPSFSTTSSDELLVVFASSAGPTSLSSKQTLAVSGAGLTWTLVNRSNAQFGTSEIWAANAASPVTSGTITSVQSMVNSYHQSLTLIAFKGAGGTGAIAAASTMFGPTSISLTTTKAGSLVYMTANDSARAAARTMGDSQVMIHQWVDTAGVATFWVQSPAAAVANAGTLTTINDTSPTSDRWNAAAVEILVGSVAVTPAVPNVVGLTQTAATGAITGAGLVLGGVTTSASSTVPAGVVISQSPIAGSQVAAGSAVALVVSSGPSQVAVPNVVGLTQASATTAITGAGLVVGTVTTASSTTISAGSVISQNPTAATQVTAGSAVALVVSSGPAQVAAPNVVGLTQASATTAITGAGLVVGTVTTASSTTVPSGSVISQNPTAATQVNAGSAVALVVSSGPPQGAGPNAVGLTQASATTAITGAGLVVGTVTTASSTTVPTGSVVSQNPTAATQVNVGSALALVVSSGPAQIAVPIVVGLTQTAASSAVTGAGLTVGVVSLVQSATVPAGVVISESPTAGTLVAPGSAVSLTVSSGNQVPVPDVVGQAQIAAAAAITNAGLVVGTTTTAPSATMPAGSVITESPTAGTLVAIGSAVSVIVSSGPSLVAVPSVVGMTQAAATASITGASLTLGTITMTPSVSTPAGLVISQSPGSATQIALGTAVSLVVSSGQPEGAPQMELNVSVDGTSFQLSTPPITTTSANELLVAYVSSDGGSANAQVMTVTGGGLNWTLLRRANASAGTAEIWTAVAPAPLVNAVIKSTANATVNVFHQSLTVMAFPAAAIGELTFGSGSRNQPNLPLTASADSSLVFAVGFDGDKPASRTLPAGQISVHEWLDKDANCTFWVQAVADPMVSGDTALITFTAPTRDAWNMVAVEIVPR